MYPEPSYVKTMITFHIIMNHHLLVPMHCWHPQILIDPVVHCLKDVDITCAAVKLFPIDIYAIKLMITEINGTVGAIERLEVNQYEVLNMNSCSLFLESENTYT